MSEYRSVAFRPFFPSKRYFNASFRSLHFFSKIPYVEAYNKAARTDRASPCTFHTVEVAVNSAKSQRGRYFALHNEIYSTKTRHVYSDLIRREGRRGKREEGEKRCSPPAESIMYAEYTGPIHVAR